MLAPVNYIKYYDFIVRRTQTKIGGKITWEADIGDGYKKLKWRRWWRRVEYIMADKYEEEFQTFLVNDKNYMREIKLERILK